MFSPGGLLLIAALTTGVLVEECNIGDVVITHKLKVSNDSGERMWASVYGSDIAGSFQLQDGGTRTFTSYVGGGVTIYVARYDYAPVLELQNEGLQLKRILATAKLTPVEVTAVNARLVAIQQNISALVAPASGGPSPSKGATHRGGCHVALKQEETVSVIIGIDQQTGTPVC